MRIYFCLILITLSYVVSGQTIGETVKILEKKDMRILRQFIDSIKSNKPCGSPDQGSNHEILPSYRETVFEILIFASKPDANNSGCDYYQINAISKSDEIIQYDLFYKKLYDRYGQTFERITGYANNLEINLFKDLYERHYFRKLELTELFNTAAVYGDHCGIGGQNPKVRDQLDSLVDQKNMEGLYRYMTSPNYAMKLYGFEGYKRLIDSGYVINEKERKIIEELPNFKGQLMTCGGCNFSYDGFGKLLMRIKHLDYVIERTIVRPEIAEYNRQQEKSKNNLPLIISIAVTILIGGLIFKIARS